MTRKKKKKPSKRSAENKAKWAKMSAAEKKEWQYTKKKSIKKKSARKTVHLPTVKIEKPAVEKSEVETTPWPRAGENKEFEEILHGETLDVKDFGAKAGTAEPKGPDDAALKVSDVAEWVKWPFQLWSTSQDLPPIIKPGEALEIAEPLTRIMNRHGISDHIPPDVVDGMQVIGRTIPVIKRGNNLVKAERQKRAKAGGQAAPRSPAPQGAKVAKPIEVGGG